MTSERKSKYDTIEIDTRDMILHKLFYLKRKYKGNDLDIDIRIDNNSEVIMTRCGDIISIIIDISSRLIYLTYEESCLFHPERDITPEKFREFIETKIQLCDAVKNTKIHRDINAFLKTITSEKLLEECKRVQLKSSLARINEIIFHCFLDSRAIFKYYLEIAELKYHYPHIDLSFLTDEKIIKQAESFSNFFKSIHKS